MRADVSSGTSDPVGRPAEGWARFPDRRLRMFLAVLNHLLAADDAARSSLGTHAGRVIRVELGRAAPPLVCWTLRIGAGGLFEPAGEAAGPPVVTITLEASLDAGFSVLRHGLAGLQSGLRIEGDAPLAAALAAIFRSLRWEVEEDLSRITGDVLAHRLAGAGADAMAALRGLAGRIGGRLARHWGVADPILVTSADLARHSGALSSLESRLASLERRTGPRR